MIYFIFKIVWVISSFKHCYNSDTLWCFNENARYC